MVCSYFHVVMASYGSVGKASRNNLTVHPADSLGIKTQGQGQTFIGIKMISMVLRD